MDQAHSRDLHVIDNHRNDPLKKEGEKKKKKKVRGADNGEKVRTIQGRKSHIPVTGHG